MAKDLRHILSGFLTASMLLMLCNMIKTDHIDPLLGNISMESNTQHDNTTVHHKRSLASVSPGPWGVNDEQLLNPCWRKSTNSKLQESKGFVFVTLALDPEYHFSEIANAVVVAKYLGATLVLPQTRQIEPRQKRKFSEIYDVRKFVASLDEKVGVVMDSQSAEIYNKQRIISVRVPPMVSKEFIRSKVEPVFKSTSRLRLSTYFSSSTIVDDDKKMNPYACLAMFDTLHLRPELQESIDSMIVTLRSLSPRSQGRFVAIDYRGISQCHDNNGTTDDCFDAKETALFLNKTGFARETTIYLNLNGWHAGVQQFRQLFPNTFTKDVIVPANEKSEFLDPKRPELKKIMDLYISSMADVYVPTASNMFSDNVVARRIAAGRTQILVPAKSSSSSADDYVPAYISNKKHWAYSCFC